MADSPARQMARRLIKSRQQEGRAGGSRTRAVAAMSEALYDDLSRWVGRDGCHALFTRALAEAQVEYAILDQIKLRPRSEPYIDGITEIIMGRGDGETADALESMLVHLIELLSRLIGDDMATKLIRSTAAPRRGQTVRDARREEA